MGRNEQGGWGRQAREVGAGEIRILHIIGRSQEMCSFD